MRKWFHRPSTDINVIRSRQDFISVLVDPRNAECFKTARKWLRSIKNIPRILIDIEIGRSKLEEWNGLISFFKALNSLKECMINLNGGEHTQLYNSFRTVFPVSAVNQIALTIESIINFEDSNLLKKIVMKREVDPELDRLRDSYDYIEKSMAIVAAEISKSIPNISLPINVMYFPQLGYLIVVDAACLMEVKYFVDQKEWDCLFSTETHSYYKSDDTKQMDREYGDLYGLICDHEIEILQSLQEEVLRVSGDITQACQLCAQLDCHLAFAEVARQRGYTKPEMCEGTVLEIEQGLHPIYEQSVDFFIANDTSFYEKNELKRIMLLTGANYSGKTVYLSQSALIVFMAHLGSFVPASRARIGITDKILVRLSNRESVSRVSTMI